jgi:two-component system KDP operon response regulator KdpE
MTTAAWQTDGNMPRILLVDDEPAIQRAVGPLLRSRGYDVEIAATGADALRLAAGRAPDLVVLDLGLPDLEGTEVCRRLHHAGDADHRALGSWFDDWRRLRDKPFGPEELLARIRVALRRDAGHAATPACS